MYFLLSLSFLIKFERSENFEENESEKKNLTVLYRVCAAGRVLFQDYVPALGARLMSYLSHTACITDS